MKNFLFLIILFFSVYSVKAQENSFSSKALNDILLTNEEVEITFSEILDLYKGKNILIDI